MAQSVAQSQALQAQTNLIQQQLQTAAAESTQQTIAATQQQHQQLVMLQQIKTEAASNSHKPIACDSEPGHFSSVDHCTRGDNPWR